MLTGFHKLCEEQGNRLQTRRQMHPVHPCMTDFLNFSKEDATFCVEFATTRKLDWEVYDMIIKSLGTGSSLLLRPADPFIALELKNKYENEFKVIIDKEHNMPYDIPIGNPIFYERSTKASSSRTGNKLAYDKHITKAVESASGKFLESGCFITDRSWFVGGGEHASFRDWLFKSFGLSKIILLPASDFEVNSNTKLCMLYGERNYTGHIEVIDTVLDTSFSFNFRAHDVIIADKELSNLLLNKVTKNYVWKKTANKLVMDKDENVIDGPKEVKNGTVKVLKRLRLGAEPEFYYTSPKYVTDWTDSETERFVTRYQASSQKSDGDGGTLWYKIAVGTVVEPGVIIPGQMWFTYAVVEPGSGAVHKKHLMGPEVTKILKATRTGTSLHTPQTRLVPYATDFAGFSKKDKAILNGL